MQQAPARSDLSAIMADIEDLWKKFDGVYKGLTPAQWSRKFGKDWTFTDQPYHLAYFDRMIANSLARGPDMPAEERLLLRSVNELNGWNSSEFAKRPAGQTVEQSLEQWRASHEGLRQAVSRMTDADLEHQAWFPLMFGWITAREVLLGCLVHNWSEYTELRLRLRGKAPEPRPSATHASLGFLTQFMALMVDREEAKKRRFTMLMDFTGPGGGAWTFRVADGACTVTEQRDVRPDLVMKQSPETFEMLRKGIKNPMLLMLTRKVKVKGFTKMGTFARLFPQPKPDQILSPSANGAGHETG